MVLLDNLPTDSVLRRHALSERSRVLGMPPGDAVLRRHYEQLMAAYTLASAGGGPASTAAPAATAARPAPVTPSPARAAVASSSVAPPAVRPAATAPTVPAGGGGLLGWLKRLLGA